MCYRDQSNCIVGHIIQKVGGGGRGVCKGDTHPGPLLIEVQNGKQKREEIYNSVKKFFNHLGEIFFNAS